MSGRRNAGGHRRPFLGGTLQSTQGVEKSIGVRDINAPGKIVASFRIGVFLAKIGEAHIANNDVSRDQRKVLLELKAPNRLVVSRNSRYSYLAKCYIHCAAILFRNCLCFCVLCNSNRSTANLSRSFFWTSLLSSAALDAAALPDEAAPDPAKRPRNELP